MQCTAVEGILKGQELTPISMVRQYPAGELVTRVLFRSDMLCDTLYIDPTNS
jgi:hypothetical protein